LGGGKFKVLKIVLGKAPPAQNGGGKKKMGPPGGIFF